MTRACAGVAALFASIAAVSPARAGPCIAVDTGEVLDPSGRARLVEQLIAAFGEHGIDACTSDRRASAIATVGIEASGRTSIAIRVHDAVTQKEVTRVVSLASTPRDGRPLAVALAADELLRATWAEIALTPPPAPTPPPDPPPIAAPPEVREVVAASLPTARMRKMRTLSVDVALAGEHATGGHDQAGVDVRAAAWLFPRGAFTLRIGARVSPRVYAADGAADATALLGGVGGAIALLPRDRRVGLEVPVRFDLERVDFGARPSAGAHGANGSALAAFVSTGLAASFGLSPSWALVVEATAGYVARPIEARDADATFTALSGAQLGVSIAVRALP